jgi:hypothetical protein
MHEYIHTYIHTYYISWKRWIPPTPLLSSVFSQTVDGDSLNGDVAVDPVLHQEFLDELQKVRHIPICKRQCLPRISVNSKTQKLMGDLNVIINLLKGEPDMREISYMVCTAASLVSKRLGSRSNKVTKPTSSSTPTWS